MGTAVICERCGKGVNSDEGHEFCPNCGAPLDGRITRNTPFADNTVGSMKPAEPQVQTPQEDDNRAIPTIETQPTEQKEQKEQKTGLFAAAETEAEKAEAENKGHRRGGR